MTYAGLNMSTLVSFQSGSAGSGLTISPRPVQYAVPVEKKKVMSDPISPDHSFSLSRLPGRPQSSLNAYMAVAALPLNVEEEDREEMRNEGRREGRDELELLGVGA
jgi:hypothetical protein